MPIEIDAEPTYAEPKTIALNLSIPAGGNGALGTPQAIVTLDNPNPEPAVSISPDASSTFTSTAETATFAVSLSSPSSVPTTVTYSTADAGNKQLAGIDYVAINPTALTLAPGQTEQTVTVLLESEPAGSPAKNFYLMLSSPINATISGAQATGTIAAVAASPAPTPTPAPTPAPPLTPTPTPAPPPIPTPTPTPRLTPTPLTTNMLIPTTPTPTPTPSPHAGG